MHSSVLMTFSALILVFSESHVIPEVGPTTSGTTHASTDSVQRSDVKDKILSLTEAFEAEVTRHDLQQHGKSE